MYLYSRLNKENNIFRKFRSLDYTLLVCLLLLGFISLATMYSTDGGEIFISY